MIAQVPTEPAPIWEAWHTLRPASETKDRFMELANHELDRAYRLAGVILGNAADAEDAVGDALERAWARAGQLRDPAGFQGWFERILINACRDRLRRRTRVRFIQLDGSHDRPAGDDPFRRVLEQDALLGAVARLPEQERLVVILHFWADLTLEATAERLSWPVGTVKSRLHRGLGRLRQGLPLSADVEAT